MLYVLRGFHLHRLGNRGKRRRTSRVSGAVATEEARDAHIAARTLRLAKHGHRVYAIDVVSRVGSLMRSLRIQRADPNRKLLRRHDVQRHRRLRLGVLVLGAAHIAHELPTERPVLILVPPVHEVRERRGAALHRERV